MAPDPDTQARMVGLFLLALVLFLPPVLGLAQHGTVLGVPALIFATYGAWILVVALLAWVVERGRR